MRPQPQRSKLRLIGVLVVIILLVAGASALLAYKWFQDQIYTPLPGDGTEVGLTVSTGDTLQDMLTELQADSLLRNVEATRIYLRIYSISLNLQTGYYEVPNNLNVPDLLAVFAKGPIPQTITVTLPEGLRHDEIADRLDKAFKSEATRAFTRQDYIDVATKPDNYEFSTSVEQFLSKYKPKGKSLEGFLFPDTYSIIKTATARDIVDLQVRTLIRRLEENKLSPDTKDRLSNFYEHLNLASILEREGSALDNRKIIADIFLRRLSGGWRLDSDVTLLYYYKDWKRVLTNADLQNANNPYNTRLLAGLPPTPIANPGVSSLTAAYKPQSNSYFFFLSTPDGKFYYAVTYSEHLQNVAKYL